MPSEHVHGSMCHPLLRMDESATYIMGQSYGVPCKLRSCACTLTAEGQR